jgi:hypothetical protein
MLRRLARLLVLSGLIGGLGAASARADYTVTMCGGDPAPQWIEGLDSTTGFASAGDACTTGGTYGFDLAGSSMQPNTDVGVGLRSPAGLAITHVTVHYNTLPTSGGSEAFIRIEHDGNLMVNALIGDANAGTALDAGVPDARDLTFNVYCSTSNGTTGCSFPNAGILTVGALTLTMHDTGRPTVSATGGSLATAAGVLDVDTTQAPDGTYPVTLTAYDASGDATSVAVSTVAIQNSTATQVLPPPTRPGSVHAKLEMRWHWTPARTVLTNLRLSKFARSATITVRCSGRRCPFKASGATVAM